MKNFFSPKKISFFSQGLTMIELMIALMVLITGVVGVYFLVARIAQSTILNFDRVIAGQLAQEGIEMSRNLRDSNWLNFAPWQTGLQSCQDGCEMDYLDNGLNGFANRFLKVDNNGFYNYQTGAESKFKRKIIIISNPPYINIKAQIFWNWAGKNLSFEAEENLYDWK